MRLQLSRALIHCLGLSLSLCAAAEKSFDPAAAFGSRPSVSNLSLSPDGANIAYISPLAGAGSGLYTLSLQPEAKPRLALLADGKPMQLGTCQWVSNTRLVCNIYGVADNKSLATLLPFTRVVAIDADGKNFKLLSKKDNEYARGLQLGGGRVIDALPDQDGTVLMTRVYLPNDHTGSLIGSSAEGLGVDRVFPASVRDVSLG